MAYDRLRKMLGGDSIERDIEEEDKDLERLKEKKKEADLFRSIGRFTDSLQGIATLGGKAPRVDAEASYAPMVEEADRDIGRSHQRRKDLMGRLKSIEDIDFGQEKFKADQKATQDKLDLEKYKFDNQRPTGTSINKNFPKQAEQYTKAFEMESSVDSALKTLKKIYQKEGGGWLNRIWGKTTGDHAKRSQETFNIVMKMMKTMDPTSVVNQGEFNTLLNSLGIDLESPFANTQQVVKNIDNLRTRKNEQRNRAKKMLRSLHKSLGSLDQFNQLDSDLSKTYNFDRDDNSGKEDLDVEINAQADQGKPRISATAADRKKLQSAEVGKTVALSDGDVALIVMGEDGRKSIKLKSEYPNEEEWLALIE